MKTWITSLSLALAGLTVQAEVAPILLEACNAMEPASKRLECLRAANRTSSGSSGGAYSGSVPQPAYAVPTSPVGRAKPLTGTSSSTCFTGPRGGTNTIIASGGKNYSGC